jgi:hypothetical protein
VAPEVHQTNFTGPAHSSPRTRQTRETPNYFFLVVFFAVVFFAAFLAAFFIAM